MAQVAREVLIPETLGERLGFVRRRRGMSQAELARQLSAMGLPIHKSMIARFESDKRRPSFAHLWAMAVILGVHVEAFGATEEEYPELRFCRDDRFIEHIR